MEHIGCCGFHKQCQLQGECINPLRETDYDCAIYNNVIKYKFPALYVLKQKGFVDIETNRLLKYIKSDNKKIQALFDALDMLSRSTEGRIDVLKIIDTYNILLQKEV